MGMQRSQSIFGVHHSLNIWNVTVTTKQVTPYNLSPKLLVALQSLCHTLESEVFMIVFPFLDSELWKAVGSRGFSTQEDPINICEMKK